MDRARCVPGGLVVAAWAVVSSFGSPAVLAQSRSETALAGQVMRIETAPALRDRLLDGLEPGRALTWGESWDLAARGGAAVEPMLRTLWREEAHVTRRLLLVTSVGVAWRWDAARIAALLDDRRIAPEQRAVLAAGIAMWGTGVGGDAFHEQAVVGAARQPRAVAVASLLALSRLRDRPALAPRTFGEREAGILAGACLCQAPPAGELDRILRSVPPGHRELVLRAHLLAEWEEGLADEAAHAARLERAFELLEASGTARELRAAALHCIARHVADRPTVAATVVERLARAGALGDGGALVALGAAGPAARAALRGRGLLPAMPGIMHEGAAGLRLAALAPLAATEDELPALVRAWAAAADDRTPLVEAGCLALALRTWGAGAAPPAWAEPLQRLSAGVWPWIGLGGATRTDVVGVAPGLVPLLTRRRGGSLPAPAARAALEDELWRREAHPRQREHELRIDLVVDVLLAGDKLVQARLGRPPNQDVYLPRGLQRRDYFEVAFELSRWLRVRAGRPGGVWLLDPDPGPR